MPKKTVDRLNQSAKPTQKLRMSRRNFAAASGIFAAGLIAGVRKASAFSRPPGGWQGLDQGPRCFLAGTRIATPNGEVPVEQLRAGDIVESQLGGARPILRVIRHSIARNAGSDWSSERLPVRIARGALAPEIPSRDLYVSQTHLLHIDGILIPAGSLVNGDTIKVVEPAGIEQLSYHHIELAEHDIVLAEGAPCETFVEEYAEAVAPIMGFGRFRNQVASRLRSAVSPIVDIRNRADIVRDRLESRAEELRAA